MSDLILYTSDDGQTRLNLRVATDSVWLTQLEIAELFQTSKQNVSLHAKNILEDKELSEEATVKESLTVQKEGTREVKRTLTLYNLVSAYFDLAELNAIEQREMRMADYVRELDSILSSTGRKLLENAGTISSTQAQEKAKRELQRYKTITLDQVEKDYLKTISSLEKQAKKATRKKGDKHA